MTNARATRIDHFVLNTHDVDRARDFYVGGLGFAVEGSSAAGVRLRLGKQRIVLAPTRDPRPYPEPMAADDPWFQHFAIVVSDMAAAYERLVRFGPIPISRGGPQQLPPSTGNVIAYKFRDPDGHPLELSFIPGSTDWNAAAKARPGAVCLGVDHTAVAAPDLAASLATWRDLGFEDGPRFLNTGPEQDRLDGLDGVVLDIATMTPPGGGPHIELLHYRAPVGAARPPRALPAIVATRTVFALDGGGEVSLVLAEPDRR